MKSDIVISVLCLVLLALIVFLSYYLIQVIRSNIYHEKRLERAEKNFPKKKTAKTARTAKIKKLGKNYLEANVVSVDKRKSAS